MNFRQMKRDYPWGGSPSKCLIYVVWMEEEEEYPNSEMAEIAIDGSLVTGYRAVLRRKHASSAP